MDTKKLKQEIVKIDREIRKIEQEIKREEYLLKNESFLTHEDYHISAFSREELADVILAKADIYSSLNEGVFVRVYSKMTSKEQQEIIKGYQKSKEYLTNKILELQASKENINSKIKNEKEKYNNPEYIEYLRLQAKFNGK